MVGAVSRSETRHRDSENTFPGLDRSRPALFRSSIVHRIEPRQLRRRDLYPRDQPAAGGDPRCEYDRTPPERYRRRRIRLRAAHRPEPHLRPPRTGRRRGDPLRQRGSQRNRSARLRTLIKCTAERKFLRHRPAHH